MARLFFALWPPASARDALHAVATELAVRLDGTAVPAVKLHLTLAFLGEVADDRFADVQAIGDAIRAQPFALRLDRIGAFRRARVGWMGCADPSPSLLAIEADLRHRLAALDIVLQPPVFTPHVTLVRKAVTLARKEGIVAADCATEAVGWNVQAFALVRSEAGTARYATLREWALGE